MFRRAALAALVLWGCAGEVRAKVDVRPPPPAPAVASASATQPAELPAPQPAPTQADPSPASAFALAGDEVRYPGKIEFTSAGKLTPASAPAVEGIAALLAEHPEIDLVEVGVHLTGAGSPDDLVKKSRERADALVAALEKAGLDKKRMRAAGHGARCASSDEDGILIAVLRRSGKATGAVPCEPKAGRVD